MTVLVKASKTQLALQSPSDIKSTNEITNLKSRGRNKNNVLISFEM